MKLGFKVLVLAVLAITFVSCSKQGEDQETSPMEDVAAVVEGETISVGQVDRIVAQWRKAGQAPVDASLPIDELRKTALTQLVDRILLHKEAARKGFSADSALVERQMQQFQAQFPTEEARDNALKPMGLDMEGLRKMTEQDLSIQVFIQQEVMPGIEVGEDACRSYFEENQEQFKMPDRIRASHILFLVEETATPEDEAEAQANAAQILERARSGEDFAQLAQEFSEGPSAPRGGDLGYFQKGQMVSPFEEAAFALDVGEISDVVRTRFGYHVIKLVDRQDAGPVAYDEAAPRIKNVLQQQMLGDRLQAIIQELRENADIQENL
jgi:peptidyl-prolyl cis-trans isomerase C